MSAFYRQKKASALLLNDIWSRIGGGQEKCSELQEAVNECTYQKRVSSDRGGTQPDRVFRDALHAGFCESGLKNQFDKFVRGFGRTTDASARVGQSYCSSSPEVGLDQYTR